MTDRNGEFLKVGNMVQYQPTRYENYEMRIENINGICMLVERDSKRRVKRTVVFNKTDLKDLTKIKG